MTFWLDAQLPPALAKHLAETFGVETKTLGSLGMHTAPDREIFNAARRDGATIITKDGDFVELVQRLGAPPKKTFAQAQALLDGGASVVEIADSAGGF